MLQVTRNILVVLVVFALVAYSNVDARSRYYRINVDSNHTTWLPGRIYSTYDIRVEEPPSYPTFTPRDNPCRYRCIKPDMHCSGGIHIARVPNMVEKMNRLQQQRSQNRHLTAQTELLEAQTALLRRQLQQIDDAERYKRNQRLVYGNRTKKVRQRNSTKAIPKPSRKTPIESDSTLDGNYQIYAEHLVRRVRTGRITWAVAINRYVDKGGSAPYIRNALINAGLYGKSTKRVQHRKYLRDLDAEVNQLTLHPLAGK